jgi:hypothetical protein
MILDEAGGPHLTSPEHNDPKFDQQQPLVIVSNRTTVTYTGAYYALAHFGRFVQVNIGEAMWLSRRCLNESCVFSPLFAAWDASHCFAGARHQECQRAPLCLCVGPPYGSAAGQRLSDCHQCHTGVAVQVFATHAASHLDQQRAICTVTHTVTHKECLDFGATCSFPDHRHRGGESQYKPSSLFGIQVL